MPVPHARTGAMQQPLYPSPGLGQPLYPQPGPGPMYSQANIPGMPAPVFFGQPAGAIPMQVMPPPAGGGPPKDDVPEAVVNEEPEMQAQPGIFTNERGNLKVRVRPRRAPVHVQSRTERGSVTPEPLAEARPPPPRALGCPEP